jgi:hypothetical protein
VSTNVDIPTAFEMFFAAHGAEADDRAASEGDRAPGEGIPWEIPSRDERELEEREDLFFHSIELRNGTRKTTRHRRLDDLNDLVQKLLPPQRPLEIMDVAVSSGVSTAEWLIDLERAGIRCQMLAGDAVVNAFLISLGPNLRALTDRTGHLMQLDIKGEAVRMPPPRRRDRVRYFPHRLLMRAATRLFDLRNADQQQPASARGPVQRRLGATCRPLTLMSPSLNRLPQLQAVEDDILVNRDYRRRFHVLRAANILNLAYFDNTTLRRMLCNLRARLLPGGLLVVCRTNDAEVNNASVFTLQSDGRFCITARLNEGSEIEDLVVGLPPEG